MDTQFRNSLLPQIQIKCSVHQNQNSEYVCYDLDCSKNSLLCSKCQSQSYSNPHASHKSSVLQIQDFLYDSSLDIENSLKVTREIFNSTMRQQENDTLFKYIEDVEGHCNQTQNYVNVLKKSLDEELNNIKACIEDGMIRIREEAFQNFDQYLNSYQNNFYHFKGYYRDVFFLNQNFQHYNNPNNLAARIQYEASDKFINSIKQALQNTQKAIYKPKETQENIRKSLSQLNEMVNGIPAFKAGESYEMLIPTILQSVKDFFPQRITVNKVTPLYLTLAGENYVGQYQPINLVPPQQQKQEQISPIQQKEESKEIRYAPNRAEYNQPVVGKDYRQVQKFEKIDPGYYVPQTNNNMIPQPPINQIFNNNQIPKIDSFQPPFRGLQEDENPFQKDKYQPPIFDSPQPQLLYLPNPVLNDQQLGKEGVRIQNCNLDQNNKLLETFIYNQDTIKPSIQLQTQIRIPAETSAFLNLKMSFLALGGKDGSVKIFDVRKNSTISFTDESNSHAKEITCFTLIDSLHSDQIFKQQSLFMSGSLDEKVSLWTFDFSGALKIHERQIKGFGAPISRIIDLQDGSQSIVGDNRGGLHLCDYFKCEKVNTISSKHTQKITELKIISQKERFLSGSIDNIICVHKMNYQSTILLDISTEKIINVCQGGVTNILYPPGDWYTNKVFFVGCKDGSIDLVNISTQSVIKSLEAHSPSSDGVAQFFMFKDTQTFILQSNFTIVSIGAKDRKITLYNVMRNQSDEFIVSVAGQLNFEHSQCQIDNKFIYQLFKYQNGAHILALNDAGNEIFDYEIFY